MSVERYCSDQYVHWPEISWAPREPLAIGGKMYIFTWYVCTFTHTCMYICRIVEMHEDSIIQLTAQIMIWSKVRLIFAWLSVHCTHMGANCPTITLEPWPPDHILLQSNLMSTGSYDVGPILPNSYQHSGEHYGILTNILEENRLLNLSTAIQPLLLMDAKFNRTWMKV